LKKTSGRLNMSIRSIENKDTVLCSQTPIVYKQSTVCSNQLEFISQVDTELSGTAFLHERPAHRFKIESSILLVQEITCPYIYLYAFQHSGYAGIECSVELLFDIVLLCPVDFSGTAIIKIQ
jgi:hypothetical protein